MSSTTANSKTVKPMVIHESTISSRPADRFPDPTHGTATWKTLISSPDTPTSTFTVGVATCAPGRSSTCPAGYLSLHRHSHAEIYHVISGKGVVTIDGEEFEVGKGSVVFIPGDAEHGIRCMGSEEVRWLYVFAAEGFGEVVYRFSEDEGMGKKERAKL